MVKSSWIYSNVFGQMNTNCANKKYGKLLNPHIYYQLRNNKNVKFYKMS